ILESSTPSPTTSTSAPPGSPRCSDRHRDQLLARPGIPGYPRRIPPSRSSLPMSTFSRRQFLAAAATVAVAGTKSSAKVLGANDRVRIGVAGLNGRGGSHVGAWSGMKDVEIAYLIDPDTRTYAKH